MRMNEGEETLLAERKGGGSPDGMDGLVSLFSLLLFTPHELAFSIRHVSWEFPWDGNGSFVVDGSGVDGKVCVCLSMLEYDTYVFFLHLHRSLIRWYCLCCFAVLID